MTTFVINPFTGKIVRTYTLSDGEEQNVVYLDFIKGIKQLFKPGPMQINSVGPQLQVTRTDYRLEAYFPNLNEVSWSLTYSEVVVVSYCSDIESPVSGDVGSEVGSDVVLPIPCQSKVRVPHQTRREIQPSLPGRLLKEHKTDKILSDPSSNVVRKSPSVIAGMLFNWSRVSTLTFSFVILVGFVMYFYAYVVKRQPVGNSDPNSTASSKRKKSRKSGKNSSGTGERKEKHESSQDEEALALSEGDNKALLLDKLFYGATVGRRIGKLLISNTEIAKGSNGTIILEGIYEGRPVAVERLVLAHHDVAFKEIQNLIASDRHRT